MLCTAPVLACLLAPSRCLLLWHVPAAAEVLVPDSLAWIHRQSCKMIYPLTLNMLVAQQDRKLAKTG
jgi:hypothetical protein